jgi:hypothetical protein
MALSLQQLHSDAAESRALLADRAQATDREVRRVRVRVRVRV